MQRRIVCFFAPALISHELLCYASFSLLEILLQKEGRPRRTSPGTLSPMARSGKKNDDMNRIGSMVKTSLGITLIQRTTRKLHITEAGREVDLVGDGIDLALELVDAHG